MEDIAVELGDILSQYATLLMVMGVVVVLGVIVLYIIGQKFPIVEFEILEGKTKRIEKRRLFGEKVVPNNLIMILLEGEKILGFKITEYDYVYQGKAKIYLATQRGEDLIPLRLVGDEIRLEELGFAREIAMRYVNTIDSTKSDLNKQNPLILGLISVVPVAVLVLLTGVMFYLILNSALPKIIDIYTEVSHTSLEVAKYNSDVAHVVSQCNSANNPPPMQNITIQSSGMAVGG